MYMLTPTMKVRPELLPKLGLMVPSVNVRDWYYIHGYHAPNMGSSGFRMDLFTATQPNNLPTLTAEDLENATAKAKLIGMHYIEVLNLMMLERINGNE